MEVGAKLRTQNGNRHSRMGKGGKRGVESRWGTVVAAGWTGLGRRSVAVLILGQVRLVGRTLVGVAGGWRETHPCPAGANAKHQPTNWRISFPNRLEFRQLLPARFSRPRFSTFFSFLPSSLHRHLPLLSTSTFLRASARRRRLNGFVDETRYESLTRKRVDGNTSA